MGLHVSSPPDCIAELWLDVPAGLGAALEGYELSLGPGESDSPEGIEAVLQAIDQQGSVVAQLALETTAATQGLRGARVTFQDRSRSLIVETSFDDPNRTGMMRLQYRHPYEFSPLELLPVAKFTYAVRQAVQIVLAVNGQTVGTGTPNFDTGPTAEESEYVRFTEHLAHVQTTTGVFFNVRGEVVAEEACDVVLASRLLGGEHVTQDWEDLVLSITPEGRGPVAVALKDAAGAPGAPVQAISIGVHMSIVVQGHIIPIGHIVREIASARVQAWTDAGEGAPPGATKLTLVPAETNTLTIRLDNDHYG